MRIAAALVLASLLASPLAAQGRGNGNGKKGQGIPPGHMPPAGLCRVWYDGVPPGHQPRATNCREAERVASRDRNARVIYGADRDRRDAGVWGRGQDPRDRGQDPRDRGRAIPRDDRSGGYPYPERFPNDRGRGAYGGVPFDNGYQDGLDKGREDADDNDSYDPARHSRYRSADRGYNQRYGTKAQYQDLYREGFRRGYDEGYRDKGASSRDRGGLGDLRNRIPWPIGR